MGNIPPIHRLRRAFAGPLRCSPDPLERLSVGGFPQLLKCPLADLPDALARHAHQRADLLERHRLAAFLEAVIEIEDLALAWGQILLEDAIDELPHQPSVGAVLDLEPFLSREALA